MTDPSGADGLAACGESEVGFTQMAPTAADQGTDLFTPAPAFCPDASKIGTVEFKVPLIEHPLKGAIYLATQNQNPFGSLIALYIVAEDEHSGVLAEARRRSRAERSDRPDHDHLQEQPPGAP